MGAIAGLLRNDRHAIEADPAERMSAAPGRRDGDEDGSYRSPDGRAVLATCGAPLLANETHDIWLALDGEIVNHRPLRHTLELLGHRFRGNSDAEVALHAYEQWDLDFPNHLQGAFALGLWDDRRDRLLLARDRLGRRPLYIARHRGRLGFASTLAALLDEMQLPRHLDPGALAQYLALGCVPAPATLVAGVSALAAGELLVAGRDGASHRHRWRGPLPGGGVPPPMRALPAERHAGNLRTLLECAVADRLGDGRVGVWLTPERAGGAIAAIATRLTGSAPMSLMVGDPIGLAATRPQAAAAGVEPDEVVLTPSDVAAAMPALVKAMPAPAAAPELVAGWFAARALAEARCDALLAPVGAGQVLLSLPAYAPLRQRGPARLLRWLRRPVRRLPSLLFGGEVAGALAVDLPTAALPLPAVPQWLAEDAQAVAGLDDLALRVADGAAPLADAFAQAHGQSARLPFLDEALTDYALIVPSRMRSHPGLLADLVPTVSGRLSPPALPLAAWLAGPLGGVLVERAARWPLLDRAAMSGLLEAHRAGGGHGERLWAVLVLAEWCAGLGLEQVASADAIAEMAYSRS